MVFLVVSYNQPKLCHGAVWATNANNFANNNILRSDLSRIFVNTNNTVHVTSGINGQILIWSNNSNNQSFRIIDGFSSTGGLIVTNEDDIYVNSGHNYRQITKWTKSTNITTSIMNLPDTCSDLFVSIDNFLYCSTSNYNMIMKTPLINSISMTQIVAGAHCPGVTSDMLYNPQGIFVHTNLSLYVADCGNDRIQLFRNGELNGTTIVGNGAPSTIGLNCPTDVILDGSDYLFIVDQNNHRIVRSLSNGFQCIAGCSGSGSAPNQLNYPTRMAFDSYGNIFVVDRENYRIQKFLLLTDACGKYS